VGVPGKGLIDGLTVTAKTLARRSVTEQYPDVQPELPPRSRGVIALLEENCTSFPPAALVCGRREPD
jgi:NADH-quinone oxidoreductase subunit I